MPTKSQPLPAVSAPRHFIKQWRKYRRLTQERLAERVGMSTSSISQIETSKQGYTQDTLEALAQVLECEPGELLIRNPTDGAAFWTLWERMTPAQRRRATILIEALIRGDASAAA